jgi:putative transposase
MAKYICPLKEGRTYHIYSRAVGSELLFIKDGDYRYFWDKFKSYLSQWVDLHAYCLLPNHLHILLTIKETKGKYLEEENNAGRSRIIQKFANCWNAYTRASNYVRKRKGALFIRPFNRIEVSDDVYFARLVHYIHQNPLKHGYCDDLRDWPYSSYPIYWHGVYQELAVEKVFEVLGEGTDIINSQNYDFDRKDIMSDFWLE